MGKGDKKSKKGKRVLGTWGVHRPKTNKTSIPVEKVKKKKAAKKAAPKKEEVVMEAKAPAKKTAAKKATAKKTTTKGDDLTKIEGIGPKVKEVLGEAGISTFSDLAKTDADKVAEMDAKYKTSEKEIEIAKQKVEIKEQQLKAKQRNYMLLGLLLIVAFILTIAFSIYKQQKLKQQKLIEENRLKDQIAQVTIQNELHEERLRISRDLHDNIGSQLTFIISSVDNMKHLFKSADEKLNKKLTDVSGFTRTTITQLRDTIWALNKDEISFEDLKARLYNYIENAQLAQEQTKFEFKSKLTTSFHLNAIQGVNIYRVVQEAINNAMKYAAATTVSLSISEDENNVFLSIIDDGIGFNMAEVQLGNGLENMKKRASEIKATFNIISAPDIGTEIILTLPKRSLN